ncbi:MAG: hypothetical protein KDC53_21650, partial [Saprospiraceae bacterium]|nr:hypothetical protein [Saprospiraceae bacterium]
MKNLVTFVLSLLITTTPYTQSLPTFSDQVFRQEIKISVPLPLSMNGEIIRVIPYRGDIVMVCTGGIFRYSKSTWTEVAKGQWQHAFTDAEQQIWLISQDSILAFAKDTGVPLPMEARDHRVISGFYERSTDKFYIGTEKGLYSFDGQWQLHDQIRDFTVNDIKSGFGDDLWVATMDGLWRRNNHNWVNLDNVLMAEANDRQYFSLMNIDSGAYLAYSAPLSVGGIARDGNHWVWSGNSGLPYGPVTLIRARENTFWLGTSMGAIRRDDKSWHYYLGKRWLEEPEVVDILPLEDRTWLATPNSISEIKEININLRDKAEFYDSLIQIRHNRLGLINRSRLTIPGDISTSHAINQDNDGLWTATYLVAQCFRYAATKSEESRELAIRTYEALERLETVTGISGYPARSFARAEDVVEQSRSPHPKKWHRS